MWLICEPPTSRCVLNYSQSCLCFYRSASCLFSISQTITIDGFTHSQCKRTCNFPIFQGKKSNEEDNNCLNVFTKINVHIQEFVVCQRTWHTAAKIKWRINHFKSFTPFLFLKKIIVLESQYNSTSFRLIC